MQLIVAAVLFQHCHWSLILQADLQDAQALYCNSAVTWANCLNGLEKVSPFFSPFYNGWLNVIFKATHCSVTCGHNSVWTIRESGQFRPYVALKFWKIRDDFDARRGGSWSWRARNVIFESNWCLVYEASKLFAKRMSLFCSIGPELFTLSMFSVEILSMSTLLGTWQEMELQGTFWSVDSSFKLFVFTDSMARMKWATLVILDPIDCRTGSVRLFSE